MDSLISNFQEDLKQEEIINKFVHEKIFNNYINTKYKLTSSLVYNREEQLKGIDIKLFKNLFLYYAIDLKCQSTYINNPTFTFAFELSYNKNGIRKVGWLLNPNVTTSYYGLTWIWGALKNKNVTYEDIKRIEFMLLSKNILLNYLSINGITFDYLNNVKDYMINNNIDVIDKNTRINTYIDIPPSNVKSYIKFVKSKQLAECPINIVINKKVLLDICSLSCVYFEDNDMLYENSYVNKNINSGIWTIKKVEIKNQNIL